jgi:hypothetical protein
MHVGAGLTAYAAGRAVADGVQRAMALAAEDNAHAVGQALVLRARRQRQVEQAKAAADMARLIAERKRLHG